MAKSSNSSDSRAVGEKAEEEKKVTGMRAEYQSAAE